MSTGDGRLRQWGFIDILKAPHNRSVAQKLAFYIVLMVTLPLSTYYTSRWTIFRDWEPNHQDIACGVSAVVAANCIMIAYAVEAIKEGVDELKPSAASKQRTE
eukprot:25273_1